MRADGGRNRRLRGAGDGGEERLAGEDGLAEGVEHVGEAVLITLAGAVGSVDATPWPERDRAYRDAGVQTGETEVRGEGDAGSRRDEVLHRGVVVELEADPRLEAGGPAGTLGERVAGRPVGAPDPRLVGEVEQADDPLPRHRVGGGQHDQHGLLEQLLERDARIGGKRDVVVLEHDPQVELPHPHASERDERVGLGDHHVDLGPSCRKAGEGVGDDGGRRSRVRTDPQDRRGAVEVAQVGLRSRQLLQDHLGMLDQSPTGRRQANAARAPVEERDSRLHLELGELLGNCGRREAKRLGRRGDRAAQGNLAQNPKAPDVEHKQSLTTNEASRVVVRARYWQRAIVRTLRRVAYPLKLASIRIARRAPTALLAGAGVAAGAAMLATVLAGTVVARDESIGRAVDEIPAAQRAVRAAWFGLPALDEDHRALEETATQALARVVPVEPTAFVLFRESTIAGTFLGLGAVDGLADWVTLRSGRLPRTCEPDLCEVVRLRGRGNIPNAPGLRLVEVGTAVVSSPVLFGDFIAPTENEQSRAALSPIYQELARYHRPEPPPLVLAEGIGGLTASPELDTVYRSYSWVVPLGPGTVRAWEIDRLAGDVARARSELQTASSSFELTAPVEELRSAAEASDVAGRRLLLVGGESAALLFAFAVLAAVSMRRDTEAARRRLTWFGARRWQLSLFTGMEAMVIALGGTVLGWALGTLAGAAVASRAGAPVSEVLAHSTLSRTGILAAVGVALALALVLLAALRAKPVALGGRSFSALDAAALGALAVVVLTLVRGDLDQEELAAESGASVALVLLPGLVTFVAAVACARLLRPGLLLLERATRGRSVSLRLAALSLARHPGHAAVAAAFLLVSVGLAVFAESYRSTLARGQQEQAAFAVPLDFTLREDLTRLIRVREAAPPEQLEKLGAGVQVEPVLRLSGNVSRVGGRTGIAVLGLDPETLPGLNGWREDFASLSQQELAARITPTGDAAQRGPVLPEDATALELPALGEAVVLTASVQTPAGDYAQLELGTPETGRDSILRAAVPAEARGGRIVSLTISPPVRVQERGGEGAPLELKLELGELRARTADGEVALGGYEGWLAVNGIEAELDGQKATITGTLSEAVASRFRPEQPSDEQAISVIASPSVAAAAGPQGDLALRVAGEQVVVRVAAVAERFPGAGQDFVVADRRLLGTALNSAQPGIAVSNEVWLAAADTRSREQLAAALARPPYDVLAVESRVELERSLRDDPLARGTLLTLLAAALVALGLALVGVLLGVVSDVRDERGELDDLEAQGARPALLRRVVRLRNLVVVAVGLAGGLATAALLGLLVVDLVAVTADARATELPLRTTVTWPVLGAGLGIGVLAAATLVTAASRRV